ncbi:hypothetical protein AAH037_04450, partial [Phocaeicola vulgatus]
MNIKSKLTLAIGILVAMIVLLVVLSVVNLQILTATEPDSPAAGPGIIRKTKCFDFWERNVLFSKTKRSFF